MRKLIYFILVFSIVSSAHAEFGDGKLKEKNQEIKRERIELRKDVKNMKASNAAEIKEKREIMKKDIEAKREEFKAKIAKIKDEKKKVIVEKLDTRFNEVNAKRTTQMTKHLDKMSEILGRISGDVSSASAAIQTARDAVSAQAAKTYVITISSEANLKTDVGKVRSQLEADLKAVNELVIAARKAVQVLIK